VETYRVTVRRQPSPPQSNAPDGLASSFFHNEISEGSVLDVRAPRGKFFLDTLEYNPIVLIAGGVGITPFISMIETLAETQSQRVIHLFYSASQAEDLIMLPHLQKMRSKLSRLEIHVFISSGSVGDLNENWHLGRIGVDSVLSVAGASNDDIDFYLCGPSIMMKDLSAQLLKNGVDSSRVHFESFGPAKIEKSQSANKRGTKSHSVGFQLSDKSTVWNNHSGTLLESAEKEGVEIESGCRSGSCGTCLTAILRGTVEYIQEPDSEIEAGSCLPCIAIPKTDLILNA